MEGDRLNVLKVVTSILILVGMTFGGYQAANTWWVPRAEVVQLVGGIQNQMAMDQAYSQLYYLQRQEMDIQIALQQNPGNQYLQQRLACVQQQIREVQQRIRSLRGY